MFKLSYFKKKNVNIKWKRPPRSQIPTVANFGGQSGKMLSAIKFSTPDLNNKLRFDRKSIEEHAGAMKRVHETLQSSQQQYRSLYIRAEPNTYASYANINANRVIFGNNSKLEHQEQQQGDQPKKLRTLAKAQVTQEKDGGGEDRELKPSIPDGYWCQPPLETLTALPLPALASVDNFSIGQTGFGKILFRSAVNLTQFASNWSSLWDSVVFAPKVVEVKHLNGDGLNVPATVYLENIRPRNAESVDDLITKLKTPLGMHFISYDAQSCTWCFQVDHFSIWGLVDDDSDPVHVSQFQSQQQTEKLKNEQILIASLEREQLQHQKSQLSFNNISLPGEFPVESSDIIRQITPSDQDKDDQMEIDQVVERSVEPTVAELTKSTKRKAPENELPTASDWDKQLALANSNFSIFNTTNKTYKKPLNSSTINETLFAGAEIKQKSNVKQAKFEHSQLYSSCILQHSKTISPLIRDNGFSKIECGSNCNLKVERETFNNKQWELLSILFDSSFLSTRRNDLCDFLQTETSLPSISKPDPLDLIIDAICLDKLTDAVEIAINSKNFHLATLLTSVGQNNDAISSQLKAWENDNMTQHVPKQIIWIYKLLTGDFLLTGNWIIDIFLGLRYTNVEFESVLKSINSFDNVKNDYYQLIKIFVERSIDDYFPVEFKFLLLSQCNIQHSEFDAVILQFSEKLSQINKIEECLYVLSYLKNDEVAKDEITATVNKYPVELGVINNDDKLNYISSHYKIPISQLFISRALKLIDLEQYYYATLEYIKASEIKKAYEICLKYVAPDFVIGNDKQELDKLGQLLQNFKSLPEWGDGGKIYLDYLNKLPILKTSLPLLNTSTWHQKVAKSIMLKSLEHL